MPLAQTVVAQKGMFAAHSALASLATKFVLQALHWGVAVEAMVVMVAQLGTLAWQRKASVVRMDLKVAELEQVEHLDHLTFTSAALSGVAQFTTAGRQTFLSEEST